MFFLVIDIIDVPAGEQKTAASEIFSYLTDWIATVDLHKFSTITPPPQLHLKKPTAFSIRTYGSNQRRRRKWV
ncbi:hypothetical protein A4A49_10789 [Nicotiana attenuata]|uniref:Uncharacterized protein n=1 Tax=Nicotiana attenuata TaxID=49451 RepID=A0A1J6IN71_NICAT|nr:hypothetical protein A4A49_10789 [Nicotiana attenuata]